ncbi:hypothetical protein J2S00_004001 [Caldalkalibacillus uzonensis]|uniref:Uncharacterized protein n=1 Tax=Caldalkalibacillus uzonensis TaxID=353224 RepID=A0ABU0CYE4_9BACI|nr:hypothetical protein [Caldalkalibacillus uzonensis]
MISFKETSLPRSTPWVQTIHAFHLPPNYWLSWQTEDVLKRIVFFKLYSVFSDFEPSIVLSLDLVGAITGRGEAVLHLCGP